MPDDLILLTYSARSLVFVPTNTTSRIGTTFRSGENLESSNACIDLIDGAPAERKSDTTRVDVAEDQLVRRA